MEWQQNGRRLKTASANGKNLSYAYNDQGIRTQKTVDGVTTEYYLNGSAIYTQVTGSTRLDFLYDDAGDLLGFLYNGRGYYYVRNGQNDITGILNSDGTQVVAYTYDAWGAPTSTTGTEADTIGSLNPFRYRGYYYDAESSLYYLNSRYYDPQVGRFLNADGYASTGQELSGTNMFSYCGNNPVNRADPSGMFWKEIGAFFKKVGNTISNFFKATFGAGTTVVQQMAYDKEVILPDPSPITIKSGRRNTTTLSRSGNSSKPISVYAQGRNDNWAMSSVGIDINILKFKLNVNLGLENIGVTGSITNGDTTSSFGLSADLTQLKVGLEGSTTVQWDENETVTDYTNVSVSGWAIVAIAVFAYSGQWVPSPQTTLQPAG